MLSKEKQIEEILKQFNFNKVHGVMLAMDWKWSFLDELRVPTVEEMKKHVTTMMGWVCSGQVVSCGGFVVRNNEGRLSLEFVVTGCHAWRETYETI